MRPRRSPRREPRRRAPREETIRLRFGYTPDPDDAFHYFALQHGLVELTDDGGRKIEAEFVTGEVDRLNRMATEAELDVTAISSAFFQRPFQSRD